MKSAWANPPGTSKLSLYKTRARDRRKGGRTQQQNKFLSEKGRNNLEPLNWGIKAEKEAFMRKHYGRFEERIRIEKEP